jgi:hypothetical protein
VFSFDRGAMPVSADAVREDVVRLARILSILEVHSLLWQYVAMLRDRAVEESDDRRETDPASVICAFD